MTPRVQAGGLLLLALAVRVALAARWGVTLEEATHWAVGMEGAGTWFERVLAQLPRHALALRLPGLLLQTAGALALLRFATHPVRFAAVVATLPALGILGLYATPASWASGLWALALAAALHGGRAWVLAGLWGGLGATLGPSVAATMVALPLLLVAGAQGQERRAPWPWVGLAVALLCAATGTLATGPRADASPLGVAVTQLVWGGPVLALALFVVAREPEDREAQLARWTTVPVLVGSMLAAALGHHTAAAVVAMAWWGAALRLGRSDARGGRLAEVSAWLGLAVLAVLAIHVERPVVPLPRDPAHRLTEGEAVADDAVRWAMPEGERRHGPRVGEGTLLLTADAGDAAAIRYHTGLPAVVWAGCGDDGPLSGSPTGPVAVFVRRWADGDGCLPEGWEVRRAQLSEGRDPGGRRVGVWEWLELRPSEGSSRSRNPAGRAGVR